MKSKLTAQWNDEDGTCCRHSKKVEKTVHFLIIIRLVNLYTETALRISTNFKNLSVAHDLIEFSTVSSTHQQQHLF